jgi:hypothetical protein
MKPTSNRILLVMACVTIIGLSAACQTQKATIGVVATSTQQPSTQQDKLPSPEATPTLTPTLSADQIQASIVSALLALYEKPNRMEVTTVLSDGTTQGNTIEFIPPDRKHIIGDGAEYIVVDDKVYAKTGEQENWQETKIPTSTFLGDENPTEETIAATVSEVQFVRQDMLNGVAVTVYSFTNTTMSSGVELHNKVELLFGVIDGLPYQMVMDGETLSASTDPNTGESKLQAVKALTTTVISFDPDISIEAPIP